MSLITLLRNRKEYFLALIALVLIGTGMVYMYGVAAPQNFEDHNLVVLSKGSTLQDISLQLKRERVISSAFVFSKIVTILSGESAVQAGSYYFENEQNAIVIAQRLISGELGLDPIRVTIPEGFTREKIAQLFVEDFEQFNVDEFLSITKEKEGYLFPDTYLFFPNTTASDVVIQMESNFREKTIALSEEIEVSQRSLQDIVTMASIVEAEAYEFEDMKKIAGVLWKRLEIGMPLQVDVTFRYINGKGTFDLTYDDLALDSPYNTYVYTGLPPTPISNPGLDAIIATLDFEESEYLFFLADNSGTVHFSETFEEHKQKKNLYLR